MKNYQYRSNLVVCDIECYPNYFLVAFKDINNPEKIKRFEMRGDEDKLDVQSIKRILRMATVITFNGIGYDIPMILYALKGANCSELREASSDIIDNGMKPWVFEKVYEVSQPAYLDHIDIFPIPEGQANLKAYSARIGCVKLQDLPYDPKRWLTPKEMDEVAAYCDNDLANTRSLFLHQEIKPNIDLRCEISKEYQFDLRSKSDAQVGELIFKNTLERKTGQRLYKPDFNTVKKKIKYDAPDFMSFSNPSLIKLYELVTSLTYYINPKHGRIDLPVELSSEKIKVGDATYTIGIGGIHSNESSQAVVAEDDEFICDADVGSFYPSIIINGGFYPAHLGLPFYNVYKQFRDDRLAMKHDPEKKVIVQTLKIALNGSYGKLSSMYSFLYSPKMMLQVTLTGQLSLLMLIERITDAGMRVISANTDGIVIHGKKHQRAKLEDIVAVWEIETGYMMEYTEYAAIYSQSVNSYLAMKRSPDGKTSWKRKGNFASRSIALTGNGQVCIEAVMAYLENGTPLRKTIENCTDFLKFTNFQQVKTGAYKDGEYLGKVVRWYYSTDSKTPILNKNGNKVPATQGAKPCMNLPDEFPTDVDYDWYVREAHSMLNVLGVKNVNKERRAFGLSDKKEYRWGRKEDQVTYHSIDMTTKEAVCEVRLKDRHDEWVYDADEGSKYCGKCGKFHDK